MIECFRKAAFLNLFDFKFDDWSFAVYIDLPRAYIIPATIYGSGFWWCGPAIALFSVFGTGNDFLC